MMKLIIKSKLTIIFLANYSKITIKLNKLANDTCFNNICVQVKTKSVALHIISFSLNQATLGTLLMDWKNLES